MKTLLNKKLFACLSGRQAFIIIMLFFFSATNAQIVYTDVNPDAKFSCSKAGCSHQYNLDLNNDGINDFTLGVNKSATISCNNKSFGSVVYSSGLDSNEATGYPLLYLNTIINNQSIYSDSADLGWAGMYWFLSCTKGCHCDGPIPYSSPSSDGYLGLKLKKGTNTYYGWARLSVSISYKSVSFTIKDYAYNSIPNQPILAGETSCTAPTVTIKASGPLSFCADDSVILTANGTGYLYQWKKNGANITNATSQTYVAKAAGVYKCKVTNSCGSKTSKGDTVTVPCKGFLNNAATNDEKIISKIIQLNVAPNPISNSTTISFSLPKSQKVSIRIYDVTGRVIKTLADAQMQAGTHQLTWNAKDEKGNAVDAGVYFLKIQTENYTETKKLSLVK